MIKVVFVDIDNTLLDFDKCAYLSMKSTFEDCGLPFEDSMFDTFERINLSLWRCMEKRIITKDQLFKLRWPTVLAGLGMNYDGVDVEARFKHHLFNHTVTIEGAENLLKYLSQKYKIYAASNATYDQQISRLKNAGFYKYFDGYFISEKAGAEKPNKEFFDYCFSNLNVSKEDVAIIGDSPTADIKGGAEYGIATIWFNWRNEKLPEGVTPSHVIKNLVEVKDIL